MPPLHSQLRNRLEAAVKQARRTAEAAAKVALERLTVGSAEPGSHLSVDERQLRNRLRAHGRQLGDQRDPKTGAQSINRLIHECAYEHWHRMLFARFLAENHLLIHEKEGMPVTLAECDELAADEGAPDGWTLAARYAARMLPQIFRPDDPVLQVGLAPEHRRALEKLVTELPVDVFTAEDSLGWVYQFWQADRKDEVNASGDKITGETLPAVTQLFTEHYMVLFLLHNSIGAWWAARLKSQERVSKAEWGKCQTEDDCRKLVGLPGYEFTYLRFIKDEAGEWVPAAGAYPGWPRTLNEFKLLDPCCGSGHFLVAAFELLVRMRMADEGLAANDACDAVLRENLHGLELDPRCTQIAAFNLALTAWKFIESSRPLPSLNIACSGLGVNARKEDWLALANGDVRLRSGMERVYDLFQKAPDIGSLINPRRLTPGDLLTAGVAELQPMLTKAFASEKSKENFDLQEIRVTAQGMARAAESLATQFTLVATNVPFKETKQLCTLLQEHIQAHFNEGRVNLATAFILRINDFLVEGGTAALVTPHEWLFLKSYAPTRELLLRGATWNLLSDLGEHSFRSAQAAGAFTALLCFTRAAPTSLTNYAAWDLTLFKRAADKTSALLSVAPSVLPQLNQLKNPDARLGLSPSSDLPLLSAYAGSYVGLQNGDTPRFVFNFWELDTPGTVWSYFQLPCDAPKSFGGREGILRWEGGNGAMTSSPLAYIKGREAWGKQGVAIRQTRTLPATRYTGDLYDQSSAAIIPFNPAHLGAIWAYCSSPEFHENVRKIDKKKNVTNATLVKIPFDLAHWEAVAKERYPGGLPTPDSNDPTQWLFNASIPNSTSPLHVAVARLLGYRWPRQRQDAVCGATPVPDDGVTNFVDEDGIVCIPSVRGESPASERLRALLTAAYANAWKPSRIDELLSAVNYGGSSLDDWLRNGFFDQHCYLFHQRPFIWHIWDGRKDGFSALVNYHMLDHKLLEKLTYTYLGDWIKKQQEAVTNGESGADDRLLKAQQLQDRLKLILEGEAPYDIFVRWKPLEQQPIGWNPDLNDGVRLNIRPFVKTDVLRNRAKISWGVDRGNNPPGSPWGEKRDNDKTLPLREKQNKTRNT